MVFTVTKQTDKVVLSVLHHKKEISRFSGIRGFRVCQDKATKLLVFMLCYHTEIW